jgi:signal transduction histidine kinase
MIESAAQKKNDIAIGELINGLDAGVYTLSVQAEGLVCNFVNSILSQWSDCPAESLIGQADRWLEHLHSGDRDRVTGIYQRVIRDKETAVVEYRVLGSGNTMKFVQDTIRPMIDSISGDVSGLVGCAQDMTFFRQAQQELERTQLLQSMGHLVAGIAHEINTPVQFIGDNLQFLSDAWEMVQEWMDLMQGCIAELEGNAAAASQIAPWREKIEAFKKQADTGFMLGEFPVAVSQSLEGVERVAKLVSAMRDFSHVDERRMAPANMNQAIESTLTILRNELKYTTDVETEFDSTLPDLHCAIDELNQVFLNLLVNAGHSIEEKIEQGHLQRGLIRVRTRAEDDAIVLIFQDNGTGIKPEIQHKIFDRFFTTKRHHPGRRGTGQGLAMVHSIIVERHQGQIMVDSKPGEGTTFTIVLPKRKLEPVEG